MLNKIFMFLVAAIIYYPTMIFAVTPFSQIIPDKFQYPFYFGVTTGYGSTTWGGLVPPENKASVALSMSTPTSVSEGGAIWGFFGGYEIIPTFAIEGGYTHYPTANIYFDSASLFTFNHNGLTSFSTKTETLALAGKFMFIIPNTTVRAFSTAGAAGVHREDVIANRWRLSPAFGVGLNYNLTERLMVEGGVGYTGGYGESELDPAEDYIPFLYSGFVRLAFRF